MSGLLSKRLFRYGVLALTILLLASAVVSAKESRNIRELSIPQIEEELQVCIGSYNPSLLKLYLYEICSNSVIIGMPSCPIS